MSHSRPGLAETATAELPKIGRFEPIDTATGPLVSLVYSEYQEKAHDAQAGTVFFDRHDWSCG